VKKDFTAAVNEVKDFINGRRAQIQQVIDNPPVWSEELRERNCSGKDGGDSKDGDGNKTCVDGETFEMGGKSFECVDGEIK